MRPIAHFKTITKHKWYVLQYCFRAGLYWQGLTHDLSKYAPIEFMVGAKYYQGEYWIDYKRQPDGTVRLAGMRMPEKYVVEMFCDRLAASRVYKGKDFDPSAPYQYYMRGKDANLLHEDSAALLETLLTILKDEGEEAVFDYIRQEVLKNEK